ncbi:hypothetical protein HYZ99_05710 [Candidatus Peregrinibacteria bacterium]|nr:hypothetical protein [Candidatus Peregrinibacteria bacterium]
MDLPPTLFLQRKSIALGAVAFLLAALLMPRVFSSVSRIAYAQVCTPVSTAALLGHWKFDEGAGTTTADSTGNGHTGTLENGPTWTTGTPVVVPNPAALSFDGTDDQVRVAQSGDFSFGTGSFTVTGFARTATGGTSLLGNFSTSHRGWGLYFYSTNRVNFFGYGNLGINDTSQAVTLLDDQWHHVAGVYTRSGASLTIDTYVDGVLVGTNTATVGDITANSDLLFGKYLLQPHYDGRLDDIRIYGRPLSGAEVGSLAAGCGNAGSSSSSSVSSSLSSSASSAACLLNGTLVAHWKLDENTGLTAHDSTVFNNSGMLLNGATWSLSTPPAITPNPSALELDGTNDYVLVPDSTGIPAGATARTIALWADRDALSTQGSLVALGNADDGTQKFILQLGTVAGNTYLFTDGINSANNITLTGSQIPAAGWHHMAFVYDGVTSWRYYLDGALSKSGSFTVPINTNTNDVELGSRHDNAFDGFFDGTLDDVRIYASALTAADIQNLVSNCVSSSSSVSSSVSSSLSSSLSSSVSSTGSSVSSSLSSSASSVSSSSSAGTVPQCDGQNATVYVQGGFIVGGPDHGDPYTGTLDGGNGNDVIVGTSGNDRLRGRNGNDLLCGGAGDDKLYGGNGNDELRGGTGDDILHAGNGTDLLFGGDGSDDLRGGNGLDVLCGWNNPDLLVAGSSGDQLDGGNAFDFLNGNSGSDTCANGESLQSCETLVASVAQCQSDPGN